MSLVKREENFYYSEIIPTIIEQLKLYYGTSWNYADVELLCGCSRTTTKKYADGYIEQIRPSTWHILKTFPLQDNRFYTPWLDDDTIFIATTQGIKEKKTEVKKSIPISSVKKQEQKSETAVLYKQVDIARIPETPGVYMLANIATPLYNLTKQHFLIKVGMSTTNLRNRIKSYPGMNPVAFVVDYKTTANGEKAVELEKSWHSALSQIAKCNVANTEWFEVSFEDFKKLVKKGLH